MDRTIKLISHDEAQALAGLHDENLKKIEKAFSVKTTLRGDHVKITGSAARIKKAVEFIETVLERIRCRGIAPTGADFRRYLSAGCEDPAIDAAIGAGIRHGHIGPKTQGQREYVEAITTHDIVFGIGPAGTGKTYLAMSCAVEALKTQRVRRIILTRPAVEAAGESLGFLPGGVHDKISPYLRPLYDALYDMMDAERIEKYIETGIIEVAPLAYMRGRTLNDAFIILDEAQNCSAEQMKMFLTRLGFDSKAVITGDMTQSDLPGGKPIGLIQAQELLREVEGIQFIRFSGSDVVRHALVQRIIEAYERSNRET